MPVEGQGSHTSTSSQSTKHLQRETEARGGKQVSLAIQQRHTHLPRTHGKSGINRPRDQSQGQCGWAKPPGPRLALHSGVLGCLLPPAWTLPQLRLIQNSFPSPTLTSFHRKYVNRVHVLSHSKNIIRVQTSESLHAPWAGPARSYLP